MNLDEYTREDLDRLYFVAHGLDGNTTVAELNAKQEAAIVVAATFMMARSPVLR